MEKIVSSSSKTFKLLKKLYKNPSVKDEKFIIEGPNLVNSAKEKGVLLCEYNSSNFDTELLNKISKSSQSVLGIAKKPHYELVDFLKMNRIIILDRIQDPGNVGTIIRNAVGFNYDGIILTENSVNVWTHKVLRATVGEIFNIPIIQNVSLPQIEKLKNDFTVFATSSLNSKKTKVLNDVKLPDRSAIIFGNEANGISDNLLEMSDEIIKIPVSNESLNVAVAAGIVLYSLNQK